VTLGVAKREIKVEQALSDTVAGMDDALLKAVQASNVALHRLTGEGYDYEDSNLKQALDELERLEDAFLHSIVRATESAGDKLRAPWDRVLEKTRRTGTATGTQVAATLRDYAKRAQTAMREQRALGFKTAHLLTQNFAILASGILIGMSEGLGRKPWVSQVGDRTQGTKAEGVQQQVGQAPRQRRPGLRTAKRTKQRQRKFG
jgi:hypothetical protein